MLSGYRVFSRRYVKSFPSLSSGFETETELPVHALHLRMPIAEIVTAYKDRPTGSTSKLSTYKDGCRILLRILAFIKEERPMAFFSSIALCFALSSVGLMVPILTEFIETGLVPRLPTAVLSMSMMIIGFLSFACGLILDTVSRDQGEMEQGHEDHGGRHRCRRRKSADCKAPSPFLYGNLGEKDHYRQSYAQGHAGHMEQPIEKRTARR